MSARPRVGVPWAGVFAGPVAWAVNTQVAYAAVPWVCGHHLNFTPAVALALAAVSLVGSFLSWRAWTATGGSALHWRILDGKPFNFLAGVGVLMGILFALVILVQGAAGLILHGCER